MASPFGATVDVAATGGARGSIGEGKAGQKERLMPSRVALVHYDRCDPKKCDGGICAAALACPRLVLKQETSFTRYLCQIPLFAGRTVIVSVLVP